MTSRHDKTRAVAAFAVRAARKAQLQLSALFLGILFVLHRPRLSIVYLETAQIWAGIVRYRPTDIEYQIATRLKMLPPLIFAVFLRAGFGEVAVSLMISTVGWSVFCAGFLLLLREVLDVENPLLLTAIAILYFLSTVHYYYLSYPIPSFGAADVSGQYGFAGAILILGLIAARRARAALAGTLAFLTIHGVWAMFCVGVFGLSAWIHRRRVAALLGPVSRKDLRWLLLLALVVTAFFRFFSPPHPPIPDPALFMRMMRRYLTEWDYHRQPLEAFEYRFLILPAATLLLIALNWKKAASSGEEPDAWLRDCLLIAVAAPLTLALLSHWNYQLPLLAVMTIPGRFIGFPMIILPLIVLYFSKRIYRGRAGSGLNASFVLFLFFYYAISRRIRPTMLLEPANAALYLAFIFVHLSGLRLFEAPLALLGAFSEAAAARIRARGSLRAALLLLAVCAWLCDFKTFAWARTDYVYTSYKRDLATSQNDAFFRAVSKRPGYLLISGDVFFVQIRTRRPLVFNATLLDQIPYLPDMIFRYEPLLKDLYGYSFEAGLGPKEQLGYVTGGHRELWEKRSPAEWAALSRKYGFSDVFVRSDWSLKLKRVLENDEYAVYSAR